MKKFYLLLVLITISVVAFSQQTVAADKIVARQTVYIGASPSYGRYIDSVQNDTSFTNHVRSVPTSDAVRRFVEGRASSISNVGNGDTILVNLLPDVVSIKSIKVIAGSSKVSVTPTLTDTTIKYSVDVVEANLNLGSMGGQVANSQIAPNLDALKIGDGSISNFEFQQLNGVGGLIVDTLNDRLKNVTRKPGTDSVFGVLYDGSLRFGFRDSIGGAASGWGTSGNSGITGSNFLGTVNNSSLRIITNNTLRATVDSTGFFALGDNAATANGYGLQIGFSSGGNRNVVDILGGLKVESNFTHSAGQTATFNSPILANSSVTYAYVAKTSNYTIATTDNYIDCTSGTFTVTLPTAASITGKAYTIKNSGTGVVTLATTSSQTIDGLTTRTLLTNFSFTVMSDGSNWKIVSPITGIWYTVEGSTTSSGSVATFDKDMVNYYQVFDEIEVSFTAICATNNVTLWMRTSTDGTTFTSSAASYAWTGVFGNTGPAAGGVGSNSATFIELAENWGNSATIPLVGKITFRRPGISSLNPTILGECGFHEQSGAKKYESFVGWRLNNEVIRAFRLSAASGNITVLSYSIRGIKY